LNDGYQHCNLDTELNEDWWDERDVEKGDIEREERGLCREITIMIGE
jgi:hypothetical protein